MLAPLPRPDRRRRGVTLVEMLVVVALVVLMMVILVQIFQSATGAMSASRAIQELDVELRQVDLRLRQDLAGATARFTPPLDPTLKLGYFEYGENAFADPQGEDTDDYIAFTTKAPEGQVFTGRVYIPNNLPGQPVNNAGNLAVQPVTVTSQLAEVIYFLRNGNLYRRVFLIVPERQGSMGPVNVYPFQALSPNATASWIGVNEVSARPAPTGPATAPPLLNDLGSLTNRENRAFHPRFRSDFYTYDRTTGNVTAGVPDGIDDDLNADDIPDFYPTLYPGVFQHNPNLAATNGLINELPYTGTNSRSIASYDVHAFPYIYPGMYSHPDPNSLLTGWIHSLDPSATSPTFNHSPLLTGDSLPIPDSNPANGHCQTWWGFPTWRETLSGKATGDPASILTWFDPVLGFNLSSNIQQTGLRPFPPTAIPTSNSTNFLPPVPGQFANDGAGSASFSKYTNAPGVWDDDLILSNVRSFDVKAYDHDAPLYLNTNNNYFPSAGYYDLGFALPNNPNLATTTPQGLWGSDNQPQGFGHAGRMPPLAGNAITGPGGDNRVNPSRPLNPFNNVDGLNYVGDSGSNNSAIIRLTRVWDSWSTDYTNAPQYDINLRGYPGTGLPIYPSYPAPYTSPLRGIQIQIRVVDPRNERVKVLTIRQDFTDKL